jgi:glycosyltransferase involved in cell wall biosynthesis
MNKTPLVSITIPIFKPNEQHFAAVLKSIAEQTFRDFEVVISYDDDVLPEFVSVLIKQHQFLAVTIIPNQFGTKGIFGNLNNAIAHSAGDYIQIFCQDDIMLSHFLHHQITLISRYTDAGMVFSNFDIEDDKGKHALEQRYNYKNLYPERIDTATATKLFFSYGCLPENLSPVMIKREVINSLGVFDTRNLYVSDFKYWIQVSKNYNLIYNKLPSLIVRRHGKQASHELGFDTWVTESFSVYSCLYRTLQESTPDFKLLIVSNSLLGRQYWYGFLKNIITRFKFPKYDIRILFTAPNNVILSCLFIVLTLNGRVSLPIKKLI